MKEGAILITTGIYPPQIGGPAQYAKELREALERLGHRVVVKTYGRGGLPPTGLRHFVFFLKILPAVARSQTVIALDTFSVGLPTVLATTLLRRKSIIRTGGDFLWEGYVERTKKKILLRNFYQTEPQFFTAKERLIFHLTRWVFRHVSCLVFSTEWQRDIFKSPYRIDEKKVRIIENYYGPKENPRSISSQVILASTRPLFLKNTDVLNRLADRKQGEYPHTEFFLTRVPYETLLQKMRSSRAVVLLSLSEISPNMILDAIRLGIPFICTKEVGIFDRIRDAGIFVDPLVEKEIESAFDSILSDKGYEDALKKVSAFNFVHTWDEIASEFSAIIEVL